MAGILQYLNALRPAAVVAETIFRLELVKRFFWFLFMFAIYRRSTLNIRFISIMKGPLTTKQRPWLSILIFERTQPR